MPELTPKHRKNLQKLATYLKALPEGYEHFDMSHFFESDNYSCWDKRFPLQLKKKDYNHCGTSACALGHGPAAGIKCDNSVESWFEYGAKYFGLDEDDDYYAWVWSFDGYWEAYDNTPQGAGKRIEYFLANGVPGGFLEYGFEWEGLLDYLKV